MYSVQALKCHSSSSMEENAALFRDLPAPPTMKEAAREIVFSLVCGEEGGGDACLTKVLKFYRTANYCVPYL